MNSYFFNELTKDLQLNIISYLPFSHIFLYDNKHDPLIQFIYKKWDDFHICYNCKNNLILDLQDELRYTYGTSFFSDYTLLTEEEKEDLYMNEDSFLDDDEESYIFINRTIEKKYQRIFFERLYNLNKLNDFITYNINENKKKIKKKINKYY